MTTKTVAVTQYIEVTVDETKFTEKAMKEYRDNYFPFYTLNDHIKHIAQLEARGVDSFNFPDDFVEGYGPIGDFGISCKVLGRDQEEEIV